MTENPSESVKKLEMEEEKFEKWNELPPEIKLECMKTLDLKTRWDLRNTSRTERALIDSQRFELPLTVIWILPECKHLIVCPDIEKSLLFSAISIEKISPLLDFTLTHGIFEHLRIGDLGDPIRGAIPAPSRPYSVKNLELDGEDEESLVYWLDRIDEKVESIRISTPFNNIDVALIYRYKKVLSHQKIANVHFLHISTVTNPDFLTDLTKTWIEKDVEIGRTIQCGKPTMYKTLKKFRREFKERIVSKSAKKIRIRSENPSKHLLLELGTCDPVLTMDFLRLSMIPAEMKESEYEDETKWVEELEIDLRKSLEDDSEEEEENEDEESDGEEDFTGLALVLNLFGYLHNIIGDRDDSDSDD